jgi:hypothetical protein
MLFYISQMSITNFEIQLDNNRTCFIPGQKVEGFISLDISKPILVELLRVRIVGKVSTFLSSNGGDSQNELSIVNETSTLTLFKDFTNLVGDLTDPVQVETGDYVYPFSFRLPNSSLPCTFKVSVH